MSEPKTLFRGATVSGEWLYGMPMMTKSEDLEERWFIVSDFNAQIKCAGDDMIQIDGDAKVVKKTVGQYAGQRDKSGLRIFDDDVVQTGTGDEFVKTMCSVVKYSESSFRLVGEENVNLAYYVGGDIKVVGNIHEPSSLPDEVREKLEI